MVSQRVQELYKKAVFLTAVQNKRAVLPSGVCLYRASDGSKCAIGHLIPDGHPAQCHRGVVGSMASAHQDIAELLGMEDGFGGETHLLWSELQTIHDVMKEPLVLASDQRRDYNRRPFGVSFGAYFWARSRALGIKNGFDIGNYPRAAINEARASTLQ